MSATGYHGRAPLKARPAPTRGDWQGGSAHSRQRAPRGAPPESQPLPAAARGSSGEQPPCVTADAPLQRAHSGGGDDGSAPPREGSPTGGATPPTLRSTGQRSVARRGVALRERASNPPPSTSAGAPHLSHVIAACIAPQPPLRLPLAPPHRRRFRRLFLCRPSSSLLAWSSWNAAGCTAVERVAWRVTEAGVGWPLVASGGTGGGGM